MKLSHAEAQALVSARLDGPLDPVAERELNAHLATCDSCRAFNASTTQLARALQTLPYLPASPAVTRAVLDHVSTPRSPWSWVSGSLPSNALPVASAIAAAVIVVFIGAFTAFRFLDLNDEPAVIPASTQTTTGIAQQLDETPGATLSETAAEPTTRADTATEPAETDVVATSDETNLATETETEQATEPTPEPPTEPSSDVPATEDASDQSNLVIDPPPSGTENSLQQQPTEAPVEPTEEPAQPTESPQTPTTETSTEESSSQQSLLAGTDEPTEEPTEAPAPTEAPVPTEEPTAEPTEVPAPTEEPTAEPTELQIIAPPTDEPTPEPTAVPTDEPTAVPAPTEEPTAEPTEEPTAEPTEEPTAEPTEQPIIAPPTLEPTPEPTDEPTPEPTAVPTDEPTAEPTDEPTPEPTVEPTDVPIIPREGSTVEVPEQSVTEEPIIGDSNGTSEIEAVATPPDEGVDPDEGTGNAGGDGEQPIIEPSNGSDDGTTVDGQDPGTEEDPSTEQSSGFDSGNTLSSAEVYRSLDSVPGDPSLRLGLSADGELIFSSNPGRVSLEQNGITLQSGEGASGQVVVACDGNGSCVDLSSSSAEGSGITDTPIGWLNGEVIYERLNGEEYPVEFRAISLDPNSLQPLGDRSIGGGDADLETITRPYPVNGSLLVPTSSSWLMISSGSVDVIDSNPYGGLDQYRINPGTGQISYVAGGNLILASLNAPGSAILDIPFGAQDYDFSPDGSRIAVVNNSQIEIWDTDGNVLATYANDEGIALGSLGWFREGLLFADLSNGVLRVIQP